VTRYDFDVAHTCMGHQNGEGEKQTNRSH
jgi:hypothetical protein